MASKRTFSFRVGFYGGLFDLDHLGRLVAALLPRELRPTAIDGGPALDPDRAVEQISSHYQGLKAPHRRSGLKVDVDAGAGQYVGLTHLAWSDSLSTVHGTVSSMEVAVGIVERAASVVDVIDGFVTPDRLYGDRVKRHLKAVQAAHGQAAFPFNSRWGLSGVACRMFLGPVFVELIGAEKLGALVPNRAKPVDGGWWVSGCDSPEEWEVEQRCATEQTVVETLGSDPFFNPDTFELASTLPDLESYRPSYPRFVVTDDGRSWARLEVNGERSTIKSLPW